MAKPKNPDFINLVTPRGTARYPWLESPNTKFKELGEFSVDFIIPEDEAANLIGQLDELNEKFFAKAKEGLKPVEAKKLKPATPYKKEEDDDGNETGNIIISFKRDAVKVTKDGERKEWSPALFDAFGQKIEKEIKIGSGSTIKVSFLARPMGNNPLNLAGVKLVLNAVQVINLVQWGGCSAEFYGFDREEDGFAAKAQDKDDASEAGDDDF